MRWHHAGIEVKDLERSIQFYKNIFGFEFEESLTLPGEKISFLIKDGIRIELIESEILVTSSCQMHISWEVSDMDKWMKILHEKGLSPLEGPYKLENGWESVFFEGPDEEVIELIQVNKNEL